MDNKFNPFAKRPMNAGRAAAIEAAKLRAAKLRAEAEQQKEVTRDSP
jgi:hypothetical protein